MNQYHHAGNIGLIAFAWPQQALGLPLHSSPALHVIPEPRFTKINVSSANVLIEMLNVSCPSGSEPATMQKDPI